MIVKVLRKEYKAFYITAIVVALFSITASCLLENSPLPTFFAIVSFFYCLLMPALGLRITIIVVLSLSFTSAILLPVAMRSGGSEMKYFAGLFGLFCSKLSPPTILGLAVHGIFLLIKKKKKQNTSNLESVSQSAINIEMKKDVKQKW